MCATLNYMDRDFKNWLAGFIDGEGCFGIYKRKDSAGWIFRFFIKLRDDDAQILYDCQSYIGGTVRLIASTNPKWGGQVVWSVSSRSDCLKLIELLDEHPLRAKKRLDYALWRRAVFLFDDVQRHVGNSKAKAANKPIWDEISSLKEQLTELRRYKNAGL